MPLLTYFKALLFLRIFFSNLQKSIKLKLITQNKEFSTKQRGKPKPKLVACPTKSPNISLEDEWAEILIQHCPTYICLFHFETCGNVYCHHYPSLTAKSCTVDNLTFVEDQNDAEEKYPPYSCIITATSLQNKELLEQGACACTLLVYLTMWKGFHPLFLVQTWSVNKHVVMMPTSWSTHR